MSTTVRNLPAVAVIAVVLVIISLVLAVRPLTREITLGPADGTVVQVDDGLVYFIWDGGKQRIQQPAAYSETDLEVLGLSVGEPAPPQLTVGEEGSHFAIYPHDGPDAKLYLVDGETLHLVDVARVSLDEIAELGEISEPLLITSVRIP